MVTLSFLCELLNISENKIVYLIYTVQTTSTTKNTYHRADFLDICA